MPDQSSTVEFSDASCENGPGTLSNTDVESLNTTLLSAAHSAPSRTELDKINDFTDMTAELTEKTLSTDRTITSGGESAESVDKTADSDKTDSTDKISDKPADTSSSQCAPSHQSPLDQDSVVLMDKHEVTLSYVDSSEGVSDEKEKLTKHTDPVDTPEALNNVDTFDPVEPTGVEAGQYRNEPSSVSETTHNLPETSKPNEALVESENSHTKDAASERSDDEEDYDPEVIVPTSAVDASPTPQVDASTAEKLKEAYEAVMQSDLVKLEVFAKLSQEEQMVAIQKLLQQKNVTLPALGDQEQNLPNVNLKQRPDLDQVMSAEERAAWDKFIAEEPQYSNWETIDKFPEGLRIFIGNLFNNSNLKEQLFRVLRLYGNVRQITIKLGYGFAQFETSEEARNCLAGERDLPFQGRILRFNTSYRHRNSHGQLRGRERTDDENDQKRFKSDNADVQMFVTENMDTKLDEMFRNCLRSANLHWSAKNVSAESSEQMIEAAHLGAVGACVLKGSKIDLQVFQETRDGGVKFDEYLDLEPVEACELLAKAKQQRFQSKRDKGPSQRSYQNDGGRQGAGYRSNNNHGIMNQRNSHQGHKTWHRGQERAGQNQGNWQQKGSYWPNYPQSYPNQGGYNNGGYSNGYSNQGQGYNNGSFNREYGSQYAAFPGNAGPQSMNSPAYGGRSYQDPNANYQGTGNNYGIYTNLGWSQNMSNGSCPGFNFPPQSALFPPQSALFPPQSAQFPSQSAQFPSQSAQYPP